MALESCSLQSHCWQPEPMITLPYTQQAVHIRYDEVAWQGGGILLAIHIREKVIKKYCILGFRLL